MAYECMTGDGNYPAVIITNLETGDTLAPCAQCLGQTLLDLLVAITGVSYEPVLPPEPEPDQHDTQPLPELDPDVATETRELVLLIDNLAPDQQEAAARAAVALTDGDTATAAEHLAELAKHGTPQEWQQAIESGDVASLLVQLRADASADYEREPGFSQDTVDRALADEPS